MLAENWCEGQTSNHLEKSGAESNLVEITSPNFQHFIRQHFDNKAYLKRTLIVIESVK